MPKKTVVIIFLAAFPVAIISFLAKKGAASISTGLIFDQVYLFFRTRIWESISVVSLGSGIWFSFVRRRVFLSLILLVICFLSSFVFPAIF